MHTYMYLYDRYIYILFFIIFDLVFYHHLTYENQRVATCNVFLGTVVSKAVGGILSSWGLLH